MRQQTSINAYTRGSFARGGWLSQSGDWYGLWEDAGAYSQDMAGAQSGILFKFIVEIYAFW